MYKHIKAIAITIYHFLMESFQMFREFDNLISSFIAVVIGESDGLHMEDVYIKNQIEN